MSVRTITLNASIDWTFSVERVVSDRKLPAKNVREYPGGGGINVARAIARLGGEAHALWSCGGDTGRRLAEMLDAESVAHTPVPIEGSVRTNPIATDESNGQQYRFGMPGTPLSHEDRDRWIQHLAQVPAGPDLLVLSGSLPAGTDPELYDDILRALPPAGRIVVDAKGELLRRALRFGVYLVKPNFHELEAIAGGALLDESDIERAASALIEGGGAKSVLVSLGGGGAMLVTAGGTTQRIPAPAVPIRSRVGAGDSMVGGLVHALNHGASLEDACLVAISAGAAAVMTEGTELCRREDAERLLRVMSAAKGGSAAYLPG